MKWTLKAVVFTVLLTTAILTASISVQPATAHTRAQAKRIVARVANQRGLCKADRIALYKIAKRESNYRHLARSNGGNGKYKGIFQLGFKKMGSKWKDPAWNTRRAIKYIKHRYGTPRKALAHSNRYGWY